MVPKKSGPTFSQEELDNRQPQFARILFLKQLDILCPCVRADLLKIWERLERQIRAAVSALQDQLDEAFDASPEKVLAAEEGTLHGLGPTANVWSWYRTAPQGPDTLRSELESDIHAWARKHQIELDWIIDTAIENIARWCDSPTQENRQGWFPPSVGMLGILTAEESTFQLRLPRIWEPTFEKPAVAKKRIETAFKAALKEWMERNKKLAKERGSQRIPNRPQLEKHIGWLIRQRILGQGSTEISKKDRPDKAADRYRVTVDEGIKTASDLIGFDSA
jgi:hypothetical protein